MIRGSTQSSAAWQRVRQVAGKVRGVSSLLAFLFITALIFRSFEFALIVTASLGLHELGHAAALAHYGLDWRISFGVIGAYTWSPLRERAALSQLQNTSIHLAGPFMSLVLAILALAAHKVLQPEGQALLVLANFSAQVGFLNLLPAGSLTDGGKICNRLVQSLDISGRKWAVAIPALAALPLLVIYALVAALRIEPGGSRVFLFGLMLLAAWLGCSLLIEALVTARRAVRPVPPVVSSPMNTRQAYAFLIILWDMLLLYMLVIEATPFWLTPDYMLGLLQNLMNVFSFLIH